MDVTWIKIDSWHIMRGHETRGSVEIAETVCGLERMWDGTSIDRLPGGSEKSCENCLKIYTRANDEPDPVLEIVNVKPKRARKSK